MLPKVRQALDAIEDVLLVGDQAAKDLAAILSALRGPDNADDAVVLKGIGTLPVRGIAFPRLRSVGFFKITENEEGSYGWTMPLDGQALDKSVATLRHWRPTHFTEHVIWAIEALERTDGNATN